MFDLTGKVALVTGASRGIGKGITLAPVECGADVIYLESDEARYVTGAKIDVNGGSHIH